MIAYADASFVVSAFGRDQNSPVAVRWLGGFEDFPVLVSRLTLFEARNAIRSDFLDRIITAEDQRTYRNNIERGLLEGMLKMREVPPHRWFPQAQRISDHDRHNSAARALDILHIAAAIELRATGFLSFDRRQRTLAADEGLTLGP